MFAFDQKNAGSMCVSCDLIGKGCLICSCNRMGWHQLICLAFMHASSADGLLVFNGGMNRLPMDC